MQLTAAEIYKAKLHVKSDIFKFQMKLNSQLNAHFLHYACTMLALCNTDMYTCLYSKMLGGVKYIILCT